MDPGDQGVREPSLQNKSPAFRELAGAPSAWCRSNILGLEPRDRRCKSCRADQFSICCRGRKRRGVRLLNESMQVQLLPAAPLPGGVKVARRPVKPLVLVRVQAWQPIQTRIAEFGMCNIRSHASSLVPFRTPHSAFRNFGRQADTSWLHPSRKRCRSIRGGSITHAFRHLPKPQRKEIP